MTRGHRGLRAVHAAMRLVLVAALVVLLALIAVRVLRGFSALASGGGPVGVLPTAALPVQGIGETR